MKSATKPKTLDVWVVKYWETQGVYRVNGEISTVADDMIVVGPLQCLHRGDWAPTLEVARDMVAVRLRKRIAALEKKIAKLRAMDPSAFGKERCPDE